MVKTRRAALVL